MYSIDQDLSRSLKIFDFIPNHATYLEAEDSGRDIFDVISPAGNNGVPGEDGVFDGHVLEGTGAWLCKRLRKRLRKSGAIIDIDALPELNMNQLYDISIKNGQNLDITFIIDAY